MGPVGFLSIAVVVGYALSKGMHKFAEAWMSYKAERFWKRMDIAFSVAIFFTALLTGGAFAYAGY